MVKILFVCMGNICRSPIAEGGFRNYLQEQATDLQIFIDSAGTHAYHVGEPPDHRAQAAAGRRGIDISASLARRVEAEDFERFDYILAMDRLNFETLRLEAADEFHEKIRLFLDFSASRQGTDVPDPYYGGTQGFELVLDLVEECSASLLDEIRTAAANRQR
jgi:protein-tyrosine phosphatase